MATNLATLLKPDIFRCKKKGDNEQLLQDFQQYRAKMETFFMAAQAVAEHTGDVPGREAEGHRICSSCKQEKALVVILGGDEMDKLFKHVGGVEEQDTYVQAMHKVEKGIKALTNQATARFKLYQEMRQEGRGFREWSQLVVEQADRCDWTGYDRVKAARDAILFQMDDSKLRRKIIAEDQKLSEVIKLGIANEQAVKVADRIKPKQEQEAPRSRIAALEEQVRALARTGGPKQDLKKKECMTCTNPTHGEGKCKAKLATCFACERKGHFKGSKACKGQGQSKVRAVSQEVEEQDTNSEAESVGRVEELVRASQEDKAQEEVARVKVTVKDKGTLAQTTQVKFLVDSGVNKTLISEKVWNVIRDRSGQKAPGLKRCTTQFRPYGTKQYLPILGRSKCILQAQAGYSIQSMVYVVRGEEQCLLGKEDAKKLGIIDLNMQGRPKTEDTVNRVQKVIKEAVPVSGQVSGGQTQLEINRNMEKIIGKLPKLFQGLGRAKVDPIHIEVDKKVKPIQQRRRPIALHYVDKLNKHLEELKQAGVISGPLGSEWARGWICNPVITGKKWDTEKIRMNLDTRTMKDAVSTSKFPIPTVEELRHAFRGSNRFSVLDMNHSFHQFELDEESKKLFVFYAPGGLFCFNTLVMGTAPASSECHERIKNILAGLTGVVQIKDDLVVHGDGQEHDRRLQKVLKRLEEYNLTLRKDKCQFGMTEVTWFGMIFSQQGMSPDPAKVQIIKDWPAPEDKAAVKSFLQTCQFSAGFMRPSRERTYADVTLPLRRLTAQHVRFRWTEECKGAFEELKQLLVASTVMVHWDVEKATRIYVDHGPAGVAGTVAQNHAGPGEPACWRPVHYASRSLTPAETKYGKVDGESLAVMSMILTNRRYLYGTAFQAVTDHKPLCSMYNRARRELPTRVARHISKLGGFDFELAYEPGSTTPSDYGSRHPASESAQESGDQDKGVEHNDEEAEFIVNRIEHEGADAITMQQVQDSTRKDSTLQALKEDIRGGTLRCEARMEKYKECFGELSVAAEVVLRGEKLVLPRELVGNVLEAAHEGHPGMQSMLTQMRQMYWWPGLTKDVTEYVETCNVGCAASVAKNSPPPMVIRETPREVWQEVAMDFKGPIVGNGKSYYLHVVIDLLSRWPEVAVVSSTSFEKLHPTLERLWSRYGVPETVTTDNGPPYSSKDWEVYARQVGFQHKPCSPEHPEGNGVAERFMGVLVKTVHAAVAEKKDPKLELEKRLMQYRNTVHPSTGKAPSEMMFHRKIRTRLPALIVPRETMVIQEARAKDQQERLKRKVKRDKRTTAKERMVKPGDKVLVSQRKSTIKPPFDPSPYRVVEVKGTQVTVERSGSIKKRNLAKVKVLKDRPNRLRSKQFSLQEEDQEEEEWWEMPNPAGGEAEEDRPDQPQEEAGQQQAGQVEEEEAVQEEEAEESEGPRRSKRVQDQEQQQGRKMSPRERKKRQAQAGTPRREQGKRIRPPGSVNTQKGWRRERWSLSE